MTHQTPIGTQRLHISTRSIHITSPVRTNQTWSYLYRQLNMMLPPLGGPHHLNQYNKPLKAPCGIHQAPLHMLPMVQVLIDYLDRPIITQLTHSSTILHPPISDCQMPSQRHGPTCPHLTTLT
jgi:hypothetical protein